MTHAAAVRYRCEPDGTHARELDLLGLGIAGLLADEPCHYSPLVVVGPPASTTACLEDIARHWGSLHGPGRHGADGRREAARFIGPDTLAADLEAAAGDKLDSIHRSWTRPRLLLIDGTRGFGGPRFNRRQLDVLPHLLDRVAEAGNRLVVGLSRGRGQPQLPEPMASRLEAGLVVTLPDATASSLRSSQLGDAAAPRLTPRRILNATAAHFGLATADLIGPSRRRTAAVARGIAMHLIRELCGESLAAIGGHFGGRDHTTVLHALRVTRHRCEHDAGLAADLSGIVDVLTGR